MWGNIILALSNLYGLGGVFSYLQQGMLFFAFSVSGSVFSAMIYHLAETERFGMPGVGWRVIPGDQRYLWFLTLTFDLLTAALTIMVTNVANYFFFYQFIAGAILAAIPDLLARFPSLIGQYGKEMRILYVICHTVFHLNNFYIVNKTAAIF